MSDWKRGEDGDLVWDSGDGYGASVLDGEWACWRTRGAWEGDAPGGCEGSVDEAKLEALAALVGEGLDVPIEVRGRALISHPVHGWNALLLRHVLARAVLCG